MLDRVFRSNPLSIMDEISTVRERLVADGFNEDRPTNRINLGQLALAASCYSTYAASSDIEREKFHNRPPPGWPLAPGAWRPGHDRREDLLKAAAFAMVEIERADQT